QIAAQLDPRLDVRALRLSEIAFGKYRVTVPENRAFFQGRIPIDDAVQNLIVDISAGIDVARSRVTWTLTAIDAITGEQPEMLGLLPPNDDSGRGQGYVSYTVMPKAGTTTGTRISNEATIIFDAEEPIVTNTVTNTLDADAPTSVVSMLGDLSPSTFTLLWSGDDPADGSGLKDVDIWVSDNDGPYKPFALSSTATTADFTGIPGHAYRFYSVARDNAGNVEAAPATPDQVTTIDFPHP